MMGLVRRVIVPGFVTSLYCYMRYGCFVSPRSEVEVTKHLTIGRRATISSFTKVKASGGPLRIGAHADIATGCFISPYDKGIEIGDYSLIGPSTSIVGSNYRYGDLETPFKLQGSESKVGIRIGRNVWIGAGSVILDGAIIGDGVIVAANSVVNSEIPPNTIAKGNPAKPIYVRR